MLMAYRIILLFVTIFQLGGTEYEHKIHNIILYPERYSWCQTTPIQQVVASPGYEAVTIDNTVCVGACYSYSIPKTQPAEPGELIGPYCDSCQPVETKCYHVTLHADAKNVDGPRTFQKRVQIITNCSCTTCGKVQESCEISSQNLVELPPNLFLNRTQEPQNPEDVPELLHFADEHKSLTTHHPTHLDFANKSKHEMKRYELNAKLLNLLKSIQQQQNEDDGEEESSNIMYDKDQLQELLKIIEGSERELSDQNLMEFVNFVNVHNSEDLELDLSRLKQVLMSYEAKQKGTDLGFAVGQENNQKIEDDLRKYNLPSNFGLESSHKMMNLHHNTDPTRQHKSLKSHHTDDDDVDDEEISISASNHHHHLGEKVHVGLNLAHLIKGPHGSMVLTPDLKVEEKLNIDSDILKPNHDGVVISYENHDNKNSLND